MNQPLRIETFCLGPYQTNCYLLLTPSACALIDAGFEPAPMIEAIRDHGLEPEALVLTHAHLDHIAGVRAVRAAFPNVPILIHRAEAAWLTDSVLNLSAMIGMPVTAPPADRLLDDGDELILAQRRWEVRHTPGHSPGGIALWCAEERVVISGDALFAGSIGRTDFPGGDFETLEASIRAKLYSLPDDTRVFAGHGPETTIGREKRDNPYVRPG